MSAMAVRWYCGIGRGDVGGGNERLIMRIANRHFGVVPLMIEAVTIEAVTLSATAEQKSIE